MSKKNAQKVESKKNKKKAVASPEVQEVKESEVLESPIKKVSKDGVAVFAEGMHPRTRRIEAEKAKSEAVEVEE